MAELMPEWPGDDVDPRLDRPEEYEPAPTEYNLVQARAMVELLYGVALDLIIKDDDGECADCGRHAHLLAYSERLDLCRRCAFSRRRVALKLLKERTS